MWIHRTEAIVYEHSKISSLLLRGCQSEEALLPDFLMKLSDSSMKTVKGGKFKPREVSLFDLSIEDETQRDLPLMLGDELLQCTPITIERAEGKAPVIAVDVSSMKIGDTDDGELCALRAVIVWKINGAYVYLRCGPIMFHITGYGHEHMSKHLGFKELLPPGMFSSVTMRILGRLRNTLERWTQRLVCTSSKDALILFDGSLTAGTPDNPVKYVEGILDSARENGNVVLAFSKTTKLAIAGQKVTNLLEQMPAPCLLDIDHQIGAQFPPNPVKLLGRVYVAKLSLGGFTFRLDIDRQVPIDGAIDAVSKLSGCDLIEQGYPETLRLAHILSTFTANEVIGIQRFIARNHGLRITSQLSLRKSLFGPFGTGRESA